MKNELITTLLLCIISIQTYSQTLDDKTQALVSKMSIQEKVDQLSKNSFMTTPDNKRLGIPGFVMNDGPHGYRFEPSTCFPVGIAMASTWNRDLVFEIGKAMGEEFWAYERHVQLGPCIDLCRDPRNGRSAETGGEDPFLCGQIGYNIIRGIQTNPVIATVKHFNLVNKQDYRRNSKVIISERNLMEHYGYNFKIAIQEGGSMSIMSAYNLINGLQASESKFLLKDILRDRWGFPFFVMSDWNSIKNAKLAINAGNDLCMGSNDYEKNIEKLVNSKEITLKPVDKAVNNVLKGKYISGMIGYRPTYDKSLINSKAHQELCYKAGQEAMILLKNEENILPLSKNVKTIAIIGPGADSLRLDGHGSSRVDPPYQVSVKEALEKRLGVEKVLFAAGCKMTKKKKKSFNKAIEIAKKADYVIFVGGLDSDLEGEGYGKGGDRKTKTVQLPKVQQDLINAVSEVNNNIVAVVISGGVCSVNDCHDNIKGFIYAFYPGQEGGNAIADVLFGDYNPGGKLPVTIPKTDEQIQKQNDNFDDDYNTGYRYYDATKQTPLYPFGFGLSYTTFKYNSVVVDKEIKKGKDISVSVEIENSGKKDGDEVVQLYLLHPRTNIWTPKKQLKAFDRIHLKAGEKKTIKLTLKNEDLAYFDENKKAYTTLTGEYMIKVGGSSDQLPLKTSFKVINSEELPDLKILNVYTIPRYPVVGDSVIFMATVKNYGTKVSGDVEHLLKVKVDGKDEFKSMDQNESIPVSGMKMLSVNSGYWITSKPGKVKLQLTIDPDNTIEEIYEDNNSKEFEFEVFEKN